MKRTTHYLLLVTLALALVMNGSCKRQAAEKKPEVKNVILLIGDGMGTAEVYAGIVSSPTGLNMESFPVCGFHKTYSSDNYITDSAAGGTALSSGKKTRNGMIGMDPDSIPLRSILEIAEEHGLSTGLVSTSAITHATPASFIAHQVNRNMYEAIAADFLATDIDVFIGGGRDHFSKRADSLNLLDELRSKGYAVDTSLAQAADVTSGKLACLTAPVHNPTMAQGRGDMLPRATDKALSLLKQNEKGFFVMIEGSMIDWGGHDNDLQYIISEVIDFDEAVGRALEFAKADGHTLVVVTADHETGGLTHTGGSIPEHLVKGSFSTGGHTGVMVPVFAYGPGAETFGGIYENTAVFDKIRHLLGFDKE